MFWKKRISTHSSIYFHIFPVISMKEIIEFMKRINSQKYAYNYMLRVQSLISQKTIEALRTKRH